MVFNLEVDQFCRINWSYNSDYRTILGIAESRYFPIDRCLQCGFVYARFLPSVEFLKKVYEDVINDKIAEKASWNLQDLARRLGYLEKLFCLMLDRRDRAVLDFGCGFGATSRLLAECGLKTIAYDTSRIRVESVKKRCAEVFVTFELKDLEENGPYTGIILDNVLEHVPDPDTVIKFISALMVHGAIAYLSVPSYEEANIRRLKREMQRDRSSEMTLNPWEHLNYFDIEHLDRLMKKYDLVPLRGCELPGPVEIGLRPEILASRRRRNSIASAYRLLRYAIGGTAVDSVCERFYRFIGK
jgi:SAM-dependent methyltransferase